MFGRFLGRKRATGASAGAGVPFDDASAVAPEAPVLAPIEPVLAVREFIAELVTYADDGNEFAFSLISKWYEQRRQEGRQRWPALSAMALSRHMVALGCSRRLVDLRHKGGGRPTFIRLPRAAPVVALADKRRAAA
jgi:hypothetical protein